MPGIHHPTAPADPAMLAPHPRETCERDRCGLPPWRAEDQALYRRGYAAGYLAAIKTLREGVEGVLDIVAPLSATECEQQMVDMGTHCANPKEHPLP